MKSSKIYNRAILSYETSTVSDSKEICTSVVLCYWKMCIACNNLYCD